MGSVVNNRVEASTRGTDLLPGLHARIHDPLWLLARQWQLGEFDGSDAGSPICAAIVTRYVPIAAWRPSGGTSRPYTGTEPLEAQIESDGGPLSWRENVEAGIRLMRMLRRAGVDSASLVAAHPLQNPDPASNPDLDPATHATSAVTPGEVASVGAVTAGRLVDAVGVAAAFDAGVDALVTAAGGETARKPLSDWRTWWAAQQPFASGAWQPEHLDYSLTVTTADPSLPIYSAERFGGGALDWHEFDVVPAPAPTTSTADVATPSTAAPMPGTPTIPAATTTLVIPTPVTFHGSPVARYWQLEDASTDFGAIDTFPTELGKLLLAEFTACFAGDWYRVPVRVPYGAASHVEALVNTDTFGVSTLIPAASAVSGDRPWRMYEHSVVTGPDGAPVGAADGTWLLVPPVLAASMDGAPVEEVVMVRDPAADLVWGIESTVTNAVGRPVRRAEDLRAQGRQPVPDPRPGMPNSWIWRLATQVPENWIPFIPTRGRAETDDYQLVQGAMARYRRAVDGSVTAVPVLPASLLLRPGGVLPEREVPREGRTVQRVRRLARWGDGSRSHWWSWRTVVGHGEASSGLAYDGLHPSSDDSKSLGQ